MNLYYRIGSSIKEQSSEKVHTICFLYVLLPAHKGCSLPQKLFKGCCMLWAVGLAGSGSGSRLRSLVPMQERFSSKMLI